MVERIVFIAFSFDALLISILSDRLSHTCQWLNIWSNNKKGTYDKR